MSNSDGEVEKHRRYNYLHKDEINEKHRQYHLTHKKERAEYAKTYNQTHKKEGAEYDKQYRLINKDKLIAYRKAHKSDSSRRSKKYYLTHKTESAEKSRKYYSTNKLAITLRTQEHNTKQKIRLLTHYGNDKCACVICGENRLDGLSIDHINGGGSKQRKTLKILGQKLYRWLEINNYPDGYRTLCMTCQWIEYLKRRANGEYKQPPKEN
jgi:hypothetical protein